MHVQEYLVVVNLLLVHNAIILEGFPTFCKHLDKETKTNF